jgi:hypothetical protein
MRQTISLKKRQKLLKEGKLRDSFELWVDKHNHKFELVRTLTSVFGLVVSSIVLLRVFGLL